MDNVVVRSWRGDVVESVARAHIAAVDADGRMMYSLGDPHYVTYWRSSSKPIQAAPLVESGAADHFGLTPQELAVACASHNAEDFHTDAVASILKKAGLTEADLQCGAHDVDRSFPRRHLAANQPPTRIHSNCSGKHSGMLAASRFQGWPTVSYRDPAHPLQRQILRTLSDLSDYPEEEIKIGVDGCGVPVFAMPVSRMARTFARLACPETAGDRRAPALVRLRDAMMTHPHMVAGTGRFDTDLMRVGEGTIVCKSGAAALYCIGLPELRLGLAIKIEDADARMIPATAMAALTQIGALSEKQRQALETYAGFPEVTNTRDEVVGRIEVTVQLTRS
jgi:L-asparaginase II